MQNPMRASKFVHFLRMLYLQYRWIVYRTGKQQLSFLSLDLFVWSWLSMFEFDWSNAPYRPSDIEENIKRIFDISSTYVLHSCGELWRLIIIYYTIRPHDRHNTFIWCGAWLVSVSNRCFITINNKHSFFIRTNLICNIFRIRGNLPL